MTPFSSEKAILIEMPEVGQIGQKRARFLIVIYLYKIKSR